MADAPSVLVLRALKLGDFLTGVPAYRAIRRAFPASRIVLAAPREFRVLLPLLGGAVDEIAHARELAPLPERVHGMDVGIDLHGKGPECHRLLLDARVGRLIAFRHPAIGESASGAEFDPCEHEVQRWCRMLGHAGIVAEASDIELPRPPGTVDLGGATLLHAGAASEARRWPLERWIAVARAERSAGRRVLLTGNGAEAERSAAIARGAAIPAADDFTGRTNVVELAALVASVGRVICGDTGVAHLASAFRRPSVVLFGPTPPAHWGPPPRPFHRVIWKGRTGNPHADSVDPGLLAISVNEAIAELRALPGVA